MLSPIPDQTRLVTHTLFVSFLQPYTAQIPSPSLSFVLFPFSLQLILAALNQCSLRLSPPDLSIVSDSPTHPPLFAIPPIQSLPSQLAPFPSNLSYFAIPTPFPLLSLCLPHSPPNLSLPRTTSSYPSFCGNLNDEDDYFHGYHYDKDKDDSFGGNLCDKHKDDSFRNNLYDENRDDYSTFSRFVFH